MTTHDAHVAQAIAHYFAIDAHARFRELHVKRDLGLEPLDLVLFVLELEEADGPPFEFASLDGVVYVQDLITLLSDWFAARDALLREEDAQAVDWVA
jgi:acyl carrier protein